MYNTNILLNIIYKYCIYQGFSTVVENIWEALQNWWGGGLSQYIRGARGGALNGILKI